MRNTRHLRPEDLAGLRWRGLVRESTERQAEAWSPERQRSDIRRAADELGMLPAEPLFYERVGSGEKTNVPEVRQALDEGRTGQYDVLVVLTTSRLARNATEARIIKRDFAKAGVVIYFAQDRIVSGARSSRLTEGIKEVLDEEENQTRRMWVAGGMRERHLSGRWQGRVPLGYRKQLVDFPDGTRGWDGGLEIDPDASAIVRRIFAEAAGGSPLSRIAIGLNVDGIRRVEGRPWTPNALREVIRNAVYKGALVRYQRGRTPHYYDAADPHDGRREIGRPFPAIVADRLWESAQPSEGVPWKTVHHYPLSAVTRCGKCGHRMQGAHSGKYRYYRCSGRLLGVCDAPHIRADKAEAEFVSWLDDIRLPDDWRTTVARMEVRAAVAEDKDRTKRISEQLARLRNLYAWGDISEADYRDQTATLKGEQAVMLAPSISGIEQVAEALIEVGRAWSSIPIERRRDLPGRLLRSIIVEDAHVSTFVCRPELKPLLDLGVVEATAASIRRSNYTVRFSA
jgi:site-specific DNA recombinase